MQLTILEFYFRWHYSTTSTRTRFDKNPINAIKLFISPAAFATYQTVQQSLDECRPRSGESIDTMPGYTDGLGETGYS